MTPIRQHFTSIYLLLIMAMTLQMIRQSQTEDNNCAEITFFDHQDDVLRVKMRHVNITFAVNWDNCSSAIQEIFIKVAAMEDGYLSEVCKLTHSRRECSVSTGTSDCRCLTPVGPVSFVARVGEDEQTFVWTWQYQGSSKEETTKTVVFSREPTVHRNSSDSKIHTDSSTSFIIIIGGGAGGGFVLIIIIIIVVVKCRKSRDVNIQSIASIAAEKQAARKSDSSAGTGAGAAGNDSKSGGSSARSSSSGSDKPSSNPNYTSTALQEVEIHAYMDLHTRDPTYAATASKKDNHTYIELRTKRMQSEPPQPPAEGSRNSAIYANQGRSPKTPVVEEEEEDETNYYNTA